MLIAYYALHYGADYLAWSIRSIYPFVDQIHILYTDKPSHGQTSPLICPDTKEMLEAEAVRFGDPQNKIRWSAGSWHKEGDHRDTIYSIAQREDADAILVVDADEIWRPEILQSALKHGEESGVRTHCIRMLTFWRSFDWVCHDEMMPVRLIYPKRPSGVSYLEGRVLHFGYARKIADVEYKITCHGHKNEWRNEWIDRYRNWPQGGNEDLHPTCKDTWTAIPYDRTLIAPQMSDHPYWDVSIIA